MHLVFHQAALGDFVLTAPIWRGLDDPVTVIAPWSRAWLATRLRPGVAAMDIEMFEFGRMFARGGPSRLSPAVQELFDAAQTVVSFVSDGRDAWADNARRLMPGARLAFLEPRPAHGGPAHTAEHHRARLREQGVELGSIASTHPAVRSTPSGPVLVHPGSGGMAKCWPADRYAALIATLRDRGHAVLPLLGEVELDRWPEVDVTRWREDLGAEVCPHTEALWSRLAGARALIGNDAGPTHLAAAMGLPTLAIFGPSDPRRWAPIGPAVHVAAPAEPGPVEWLAVDAAVDHAIALLA
ncbi:MAG: glycosyltransferase family 9 protein [Planctomycetota bacterium]